ncbi:DUF4234 domain-containing protein [Olsenella uli]|uniref:DUF4234 domain-containing protein n=1 Tax=Olsenella uli TaxID=133926 RepID=UPI001C9DCDA1|nr:DUF4234 domain-containing protein [Olsenella uli]
MRFPVIDGAKFCPVCGARLDGHGRGVVAPSDQSGTAAPASSPASSGTGAPRPAPQPGAGYQQPGAYQQAPSYQQPASQQNAAFQQQFTVPAQTDRSLVMYILLTIVTCGIYGLYFQWKVLTDCECMSGRQSSTDAGMLAR